MSTCTTGDCDNPVDPNGFVRLNDCDCLGDPDLFPNCSGHKYCKACTELLVGGGEIAGCIWCSTGPSLVSHGRGVECTNGPNFTNRCARCGAFVKPYNVEDMKVCDACDHIIALQCAVNQMVSTWRAYDDEDEGIANSWEDQMKAAITYAESVLHGPA